MFEKLSESMFASLTLTSTETWAELENRTNFYVSFPVVSRCGLTIFEFSKQHISLNRCATDAILSYLI